jgi:hypothetical protein
MGRRHLDEEQAARTGARGTLMFTAMTDDGMKMWLAGLLDGLGRLASVTDQEIRDAAVGWVYARHILSLGVVVDMTQE